MAMIEVSRTSRRSSLRSMRSGDVSSKALPIADPETYAFLEQLDVASRRQLKWESCLPKKSMSDNKLDRTDGAS